MQPCPRKAENPGPFKFADSKWEVRSSDDSPYYDGLRTCSYCGSLHPEDLFAAIDRGAEIGPTDKNYKIYVTVPNLIAGQQVRMGSASGPVFDQPWPAEADRLTAEVGKFTPLDVTDAERMAGRYDRVMMGEAPATHQAKFYFQHFDEAERHRFIDLLNADKIKMGYPHHFYVAPFFIQFG